MNSKEEKKEYENKSRVLHYRNATGFGFSTLTLPETSCLLFFCIDLKKKENKEKNTIIEALPLFDYTDCLQ